MAANSPKRQIDAPDQAEDERVGHGKQAVDSGARQADQELLQAVSHRRGNLRKAVRPVPRSGVVRDSFG
jgi:hypothetical protein